MLNLPDRTNAVNHPYFSAMPGTFGVTIPVPGNIECHRWQAFRLDDAHQLAYNLQQLFCWAVLHCGDDTGIAGINQCIQALIINHHSPIWFICEISKQVPSHQSDPVPAQKAFISRSGSSCDLIPDRSSRKCHLRSSLKVAASLFSSSINDRCLPSNATPGISIFFTGTNVCNF